MGKKLFERRFTLIYHEQNTFFGKPFFRKSMETDPAQDDTLEDNAYKGKQESIDYDQSWYQNSIIGKAIGQIEDTDHDKKTHKHRFHDGKNLLDDADRSLDSVEFLKCENNTDDSIARQGESDEIISFERTTRQMNTRNQISRDTDMSCDQKCPYHEKHLERYADESEDEFVFAHEKLSFEF